MRFDTRCRPRKYLTSIIWPLSHNVHLQIRAIWNPLAETCVVTNLGTSKPSYIGLFATDFLLLLIMLAGLLRIRRRSGDTFELGRLLWKQVYW